MRDTGPQAKSKDSIDYLSINWYDKEKGLGHYLI
jgi:hypothetical protein